MRPLLWLVITMIIYGSLYPFNFVWPDFSQVALLDWGLNLKQRTTNGDILSNILTFIPLGFLAFFSHYFYKYPPSLRVLYHLLVGLVFAYTLQILQFFLPTRIPTASDAAINLAGMSIGIFAAYWTELLITKQQKSGIDWSFRHIIPLLLVTCWLFYCLYPYFPMANFKEMSSDWQSVIQPTDFIWYEWLLLSILWWCFFDLLQVLPWKKITLVKALVTACFILGLKLLITHNNLNLVWIIAMLTGLTFAYQVPEKYRLTQLLLLVVVALLINNLFPWQEKSLMPKINWLPFNDYLSGSIWVNTSRRFHQTALAISSAFIIVLLIEIIQFISSSGRADITDPLLLLLLAYFYYQIKQSSLPTLRDNHSKTNNESSKESNITVNRVL